MTRRAQHEMEFGSDSFLDVITNVVGILIILVLVVGNQGSQPVELPPLPETVALDAARARSTALEQDVRAIAAQREEVERELAARQAERNEVNTLITAIEQDLAARRAALDTRARRAYDLDRDLALAKAELAQLEAERERSEQVATTKSVQIESYPTPISKTVDDKEIHFQLLSGRIVFVPFEALLDKLKSTVREQSWRMEDRGDINDTLGPIGGFMLRYGLDRIETPRGTMIQLSHVEFIPTAREMGETMDRAMAPQSAFRNKLEMMSPQHYTITVWTYPDSFQEFRQLKKELYTMGYRVAARPLPHGLPIGASPHGSKSSAE